MAGDWIKMRVSLWDCPQVVRISSALCLQKVATIGALFRTWSIADQYTTDGKLAGYTPEALDAAVGIEGWSTTLESVGWLTITHEAVVVPRFTEHNGQSAKRRATDAKRKQAVRKSSASRPYSKRTKRGLEKRREEKNIIEPSTNVEGCSEPFSGSEQSPCFVMVFPCVGKGPNSWGLSESKLAEYREAFPGVDVLSECRKALQWCVDNPSRRKTARGMPAFLNRWLERAQNSGAVGTSRNNHAQPKRDPLEGVVL